MLNRIIPAICCALLVWIIGCDRGTEESLPPDEVLIDLIVDLHLAEASMTRVNVMKQDSVSLILRQRVALSNGTTPEQMDRWLETLQKTPDRLVAVYDSVIARLERLETH
jgi:hypothetical protein